MIRKIILGVLLVMSVTASAQIGEHRNDLSVGVSGGYVMSNVGFTPTVPQLKQPGYTGGVTLRYVCEKYFKSICAIQVELNYVQSGWKEKIWDANNNPVINPVSNKEEKYARTLNYIQIPIFARMGWGREQKGFQFFFQAGPQLGYLVSESSKMENFTMNNYNSSSRTSPVVAQDTMNVENKFDYGIAAGLGLEYSHPKLGHFILEGRYYYGLGDIYGNSKRDYFGRSNNNNVIIKLTYLYDIRKTKK